MEKHSTQQIIGKIVTEYLDQYPDMFKRALARLIYAEHPDVFNSIDSVRCLIRYYTASAGDKNRRKLLTGKYIGLCTPPVTSAVEREDFILPKVANNCLLMSDLHVPYHDMAAIDAALNWGKEKQINTLILNGDFMDFYNLSKFMKDPRKRDLCYELDAGYQMMDYIANRLPNVKIYFMPGNHENRLETYLYIKAPELLSAEPGLSDLDYFLKFNDFSVQYLRNAQVIQAGKLYIGHGHEFRGGAGGVNPSRTFFLRTYSNFIGGHFHRTSDHTERRLDGEVDACWSTGCLCGMFPEYMPYNKWNHGFANVKVNDDGTFRVFNAKIFNGKVL